MDRPRSWRELLGSAIKDINERQRIANELGVSPITLMRWVNGEASPRSRNLSQLPSALPHQRDELTRSIAVEFPAFSADLAPAVIDESLTKIPSEFYARVLTTYSSTHRYQRFWSVSNLILPQALGQLDPAHLGMVITIVQCMPPSRQQKVRSLREVAGRGTPPWESTLKRPLFLGIESLAGYAVTQGHRLTIHDRFDHQGFLPAHWVEPEKSATACPVIHDGSFVGCLLVSSTQPSYFLPFRELLIEQYAQLLVLAFAPEDFYAPQDIELMPMPSYQVQEPRFSNFRQRVSNILLEASQKQQPIDYLEAEQIVYKQLEEELLLRALNVEGALPW